MIKVMFDFYLKIEVTFTALRIACPALDGDNIDSIGSSCHPERSEESTFHFALFPFYFFLILLIPNQPRWIHRRRAPALPDYGESCYKYGQSARCSEYPQT